MSPNCPPAAFLQKFGKPRSSFGLDGRNRVHKSAKNLGKSTFDP